MAYPSLSLAYHATLHQGPNAASLLARMLHPKQACATRPRPCGTSNRKLLSDAFMLNARTTACARWDPSLKQENTNTSNTANHVFSVALLTCDDHWPQRWLCCFHRSAAKKDSSFGISAIEPQMLASCLGTLTVHLAINNVDAGQGGALRQGIHQRLRGNLKAVPFRLRASLNENLKLTVKPKANR